jgi:hypothetical protein
MEVVPCAGGSILARFEKKVARQATRVRKQRQQGVSTRGDDSRQRIPATNPGGNKK